MQLNLSTFNSSRYLLVFAVSVALLFLALISGSEWLIRTRVQTSASGVDPKTWYLNLFRSSASTQVVFGDSYVAQGIHGLGGFVNLAYPGGNVELLEARVLAYFRDKTPRQVIIQADPQMFASLKEGKDISDEVALLASHQTPRPRYLLWLFENPHRGLIFSYWRRYLMRQRLGNQVALRPDGGIVDTDVWGTIPEETRMIGARGIVLTDTPMADVAVSRSGRAYERSLSFLEEKGAEVCMIGMPMTQEYLALRSLTPEFEEATRWIRSLAARHRFQYVDFSDSVADPNLFANQNHLNARGAAVFTPMVKSKCFAVHTE